MARWKAIAGSDNKEIGAHRAFTIVWLTDTVEQAVAMATSSADLPTADELQASYTAACEAHMKTMGLSPKEEMQRVAYRNIDKRFQGSGSGGVINPEIPQIEFMVGRAQEESASHLNALHCFVPVTTHAIPPQSTRCNFCNRIGQDFNMCSRCKFATYCSSNIPREISREDFQGFAFLILSLIQKRAFLFFLSLLMLSIAARVTRPALLCCALPLLFLFLFLPLPPLLLSPFELRASAAAALALFISIGSIICPERTDTLGLTSSLPQVVSDRVDRWVDRWIDR